ncbi:MAG: acyltransferase [Planctomycetes bacterium]|nr:acyltransferase [Planctomycetota bacterium]
MNQAAQLPFARRGQDVTIWPLAKVINPGAITIGDSVIVDDFVLLDGGARTTIGSFVHIAMHASIAGGGELVLEDFVGLSGGVRLYTGNDDYGGGWLTGPTVPAKYRGVRRGRVVVGKHAIVGANTVILPDVVIGEGAAVGANAVVTRDLAPWTIHVGAPARPLRERPRERILELEAALRRELYDAAGCYIAKDLR